MEHFATITDIELIRNPILAKTLAWGLWNISGVSGWKVAVRPPTINPLDGEIRFYR